MDRWQAILAMLLVGCSVVLCQTPSPNSSVKIVLATPTGLTVAPTPNLKAPNGSRYTGSVNPDAQRRPEVQGLFEILAQQSDVVGVHVVHVPRTNKFLYMERPSDKRSRTRQIAGTFDLFTRQWTPVNASDGLFCAGHSVTSEGWVVVVGGHKATGGYADGMRSVRIFDINTGPQILVNATWMEWKRWYPSVTLLPDTQLMLMGGTVQVGGSSGGNIAYELYKPNTLPNQYPMTTFKVEDTFYKQMKKMYYPFNFVLPTGDVFSFGERQARIMVAQTGMYRKNADGTYLMGNVLPGSDFTQFPFTATPAFGVLSPDDNYSSVDFMVFGGAPVAAVTNNSIIAGRLVRRTTISWSRKNASVPYTYKLSNWTTEDLGIPRVMGDAIALPNGDVLVMSGAQIGVAGDSSTSSGSGGRSNYPALWAQLYQPDRPINNRVSTLAASTIARMYHGVAVLTPNATVLVTGCDRCYRLTSDVPTYVSPGSRFEYRNEIFYPPYWFDETNKPRITKVYGGQTELPYNTAFSIQWTSEVTGTPVPPVTSITLVAPAATTHSFNMNQRTVKLKVISVNYKTNTIMVVSPPNPYIAPPQWYMVFAMNGKVMSKAVWIKLVDTLGQGKVVPK